MRHTLYKLARFSIIAAPLAVTLSACQPAPENMQLQESGLSANDPNFYPSDNGLRMGKVHFRNGAYGLAEQSFRKAVEVTPRDTEAWLGLAASYDELRRFDLADNAYSQAEKLGRNNAVVLNNIGYSQLMRGNIPEARRLLMKAYELEPDNPYIANNIALLGESGKTVKRVPL